MRRLLLLLLFFSLSAAAEDGVIVIPSAPTTQTPVSLRTFVSCQPGPASVTITGFVIKVHYEQGSGLCGDPPIPQPHTVRVPGLLPAGEYRVEVMVDPMDAIQATASFVVRDVSPRAFEVQPSVVRLEWPDPKVLAISSAQPLCTAEANCRVFVDGLPATGVTLQPGNVILFMAPALDAGFADVRVENGAVFTTVQNALYAAAGTEDDPSLFERVLFPLLVEAPGANGSLWRTEAVISNPKPWPVYWWEGLLLPTAGFFRVDGGDEGRGFVLRIPRDQAPYVSFGLRARDVSRVEEGYGTEIPVVRERDLYFDTPFMFLDVPVERGYRVKLRLYSYDANAIPWLEVRAAEGLSSVHLPPMAPVCTPSGCHFYLEYDLPSDGDDGARADITVQTYDAPAWGFITVTNNETQQVTVVSPSGKGGRP